MSQQIRYAHARRMHALLGPALGAAVFSLALGGCTSPNTGMNDDKNVGSVMTTSSAPAMDAQTAGNPSAMPSSIPAPATKSPEGAMMKNEYNNGTYAATGSYGSPAGKESIEVTLTLQNDKVVSASIQGDAKNEKSVKYQTAFVAGFKDQVVGKSVNEISLGVVNGSSLTPKGFMDALKQIEAEAKA